jgi:hypothetical protein
MDVTVLEPVRRRIERALDLVDQQRRSSPGLALQPVPVGVTGRRPRPAQPRTIRPIRSWARLIRI